MKKQTASMTCTTKWLSIFFFLLILPAISFYAGFMIASVQATQSQVLVIDDAQFQCVLKKAVTISS